MKMAAVGPQTSRRRVSSRTAPLGGEALLQIADAVGDVGRALLLVADFALDAQRPAITDLLQRLNKLANVRFPLAQRHLVAPGPRDFGADRVLDVNAANVGPEDLDRPDRVALLVQQHV